MPPDTPQADSPRDDSTLRRGASTIRETGPTMHLPVARGLLAYADAADRAVRLHEPLRPAHDIMRTTLLLAVILTASCASPPPNDPTLAAPGKSTQKDKCPLVPHGCPGGADEDGCPDPIFEVGDGCTVTAQTVTLLADAAEEMKNEKDLTRMRIVAPTMTCANIFRAHLEARGIEDHRFTMGVDPNRSTVSFEVDAWKELDCKTGGAVKPPVYSK